MTCAKQCVNTITVMASYVNNDSGLIGSVGDILNRTKQVAGEKLGVAEKTEMDEDYKDLAEKTEFFRKSTKQLTNQGHICVQPYLGARLEDWAMKTYERVSSMKNKHETPPATEQRSSAVAAPMMSLLRQTPYEILGIYMCELGSGFGDETITGKSFLAAGECEQQIGQNSKSFIIAVNEGFLIPLNMCLDGPISSIEREISKTENKRLDYDSIRNKKQKEEMAVSSEVSEKEQAFNEQVDKTKEGMRELLHDGQELFLNALRALLKAQLEYHTQCGKLLKDVNSQLNAN